MTPFVASEVKALFFDVFGTLVDWRSSIAREASAVLEPLGHTADWLAFADAWRDEYQPGMEEVRAGRIPFSKLDVLHRRNLDRILPRFGMAYLPEEAKSYLNRAWHRLDAWPDVSRGLHLLKRHFGQCVSFRSNRLLHIVEPVVELLVCVAQAGFRIEIQLASEVSQHKQEIPHLVLQPLVLRIRQFCPKLRNLFVQLEQHLLRIGPIETNSSCARCQLRSTRKRGQTGRNPSQSPVFRSPSAFSMLLGFPDRALRVGRVHRRTAKHVRMAANHLLVHFANHIGYREAALFGGDLRVEYYL